MIGAGTVINPILKVVTTIAILGAVYLFIVRPILDTTEDAIGRADRQLSENFANQDRTQRQMDLANSKNSALGDAQGLRAGSQAWTAAANEIVRCVKRAGGDLRAMKACARFADGASDAQFDRNFALPYADSLELQGDTVGAQQVRECVERAGYGVAPMKRCRDLADRLLFG